MASDRKLVGLVAGLGALVVLASASSGQASSAPRAARPSTRRKPSARSSSSAPEGDVTLGPITQIITNPKTGAVTKKTDLRGLSPKELATYQQQLAKTGATDSTLLSDEQAEALEDEGVQAARAAMPGASASQQELARRAAQRARQMMSKKGVPPLPVVRPANPGIDPEPLERDDAPRAYVSPPTPINLELARREAPTLAKHLRTKGISGYSRQSVRDFQAHAGITVDGIYGPLTSSALAYFGVPNPPKAFFKPKPGTVTIYAPAN